MIPMNHISLLPNEQLIHISISIVSVQKACYDTTLVFVQMTDKFTYNLSVSIVEAGLSYFITIYKFTIVITLI
jgi:hypothetical protein